MIRREKKKHHTESGAHRDDRREKVQGQTLRKDDGKKWKVAPECKSILTGRLSKAKEKDVCDKHDGQRVHGTT